MVNDDHHTVNSGVNRTSGLLRNRFRELWIPRVYGLLRNEDDMSNDQRLLPNFKSTTNDNALALILHMISLSGLLRNRSDDLFKPKVYGLLRNKNRPVYTGIDCIDV